MLCEYDLQPHSSVWEPAYRDSQIWSWLYETGPPHVCTALPLSTSWSLYTPGKSVPIEVQCEVTSSLGKEPTSVHGVWRSLSVTDEQRGESSRSDFRAQKVVRLTRHADHDVYIPYMNYVQSAQLHTLRKQKIGVLIQVVLLHIRMPKVAMLL